MLIPKLALAVQGFVQSMNDKYTRYCNTDIPFHWFAKRVSEIMGSGLMLYAIRPMQLHPQIKAPPMEEFNVLNIAVDILAKHQTVLTTPFTEPWRWFVWVQWHPLAVALAELCSRTEGSDVDRAWGVVDVAFQRYADLVADTERGMLWSPIEKLMKKARQNKRMAAMAKLSLRDQKEPFANIPAPLPGPANRSEAPRTASDMKGQTSRPYPDTLRNMPVNPHTDGWNARIFAPDSIASNTPSMPDTMEGLTSTPNLNTAPLLMNSTPFSGVGDAASFLLDMAWNNWEDFVGEVNFADFDLSDPMVGFPQP